MEIKPSTCKEKTNSHDLLQTLYATQECCFPLKSFKVHKVHSKFPSHQLPYNKENSKKTTLMKNTVKPFQASDKMLLTKHRNKIQENISLHRINKHDYNFCLLDTPGQISRSAVASLYEDNFFAPKTKEQILSSHFSPDRQSGGYQGNIKHSLHQIHKINSESINHQFSSQSDHLRHLTPKFPKKKFLQKRQQKKIHQSSIQSISSISKSNSFFTLANFSGHQLSRDPKKIISFDEKISKKITQISGFTRHELLGYYKSLIDFSKNNELRYVTGFETMLNLMNLQSNQTTVKQMLTTFITKPSFEQFLIVFEKIVESSLKESVVDFFQIIFDGKWGRQICFPQLAELLSERMNSYHANEIVEQIYFQLEKELTMKVSVQEIVDLCYKNQQFCSFMRGYCQQTQKHRSCNKIKKII